MARGARIAAAWIGTLAALALNVTQATASPAESGVSTAPAIADPIITYTGTAPSTTFGDATGGLSLTCESTITGSATEATFGLQLLTLDAAASSWSQCTGPLGLSFDLVGVGSWQFNAMTQSGSVTGYTLADVTFHITNPDGVCAFDATGSVLATYDSSTQQLDTNPDPTLEISNVTGCFGLINDGDAADWSASYHISI